MGLFSNYEKVGPGVSKDPDNKIPLFKFIDIYTSHFTKLIAVNFEFLIAILPFAGITLVEYYGLGNFAFYIIFIILGIVVGPALCGFMKVLRNISCRRPVFIWTDFWKSFRSNFKQGAIMGMIDMLFFVAMSFAFPMYYSLSQQNSVFNVPFVICLVVSFVFLMMHFYIYLLIVSTTLSTVWAETKSVKWTALAAVVPTAAGVLICAVIAAVFR